MHCHERNEYDGLIAEHSSLHHALELNRAQAENKQSSGDSAVPICNLARLQQYLVLLKKQGLQSQEIEGLFVLVPREGIEPPTHGL